ncbi:class I SAM-dependent methyltransferase [Haloimpatiens lingqiaonensis]|uniref:class I SAM-dependent methyltransferase n=1 Tax=Haloimpatiens lingqiaonensis TaxID=1380675 RepID=UPI0010FDD060|nr:class I SAM-dependent methyltransferase [Haloimpatiens lingqiaonensis]
MKEKILDLHNIYLDGNVLDIGYKDYGIVYNLCKRQEENLDIDYVFGEGEEALDEAKYDKCVLFFSLKNIWTNSEKEKAFQFAWEVLKDEGEIYIWDIDKGIKKTFNYKIKVIISENNIRVMNLIDVNPFNDNSKENIIKLLTSKFDIMDFDYNDEVFFIRARKKGC